MTPTSTTLPHGTGALSPDQAAYDARQDARIRALRRWLYVAVSILSVGVIAADAVSVHVALRAAPPAPALVPSPVVHVGCPACPAAPACAACPACPPPTERRHR